jgi:hypothetical protein
MTTPQCEAIWATTRNAAAVLLRADIPFALAGGMAAWARGGPEVEHDVDFVVLPRDVDRVLLALEHDGFRTERPPEDWLVKAWENDVMVDIIHEMSNEAAAPLVERSEMMEVLSMRMPVMRADDVMVTKLMALSEHALHFARPLAIARALREQIDWEYVERQTKSSPFALAFMTLVRELGIAP